MSTQIYTFAEVYVDGRKLMEQASVKVTRDSKAQPVYTVARKFAGMSPGAEELMISIESAVPASDFELNPGAYIKAMKPVKLTIFAGGRTLETNGFFTKDDFSHSVNAEAKLSFDFMGEFADWT